ncbi:MAG: dihydrodipicolinate synthase family protein [Planctomycetales bacterium]|nr:dihydrodipicolinate synthase family protein [Planctomycetales bacterium]
MEFSRLEGLVAAVHSPFATDGSLNVDVVEKQHDWLLSQSVRTAFVCGSTGESSSLSLLERRALLERWAEVSRSSDMTLVAHVGSNCLPDSKELAAHAESHGVRAIAALAPSYFKPRGIDELLAWCREIAGAAPRTPFYFYDIPSLSGVSLSMPELLERADSIPNFAGLKFTNNDMYSFQQCLRVHGGKFDIAFGFDEMLLAALALGAVGAVGSTYNFNAPVHHRIIDAFRAGEMEQARDEQFRSVLTIRTIVKFGFMGGTKGIMEMLGVPVGEPRLPHHSLDAETKQRLRSELEAIGFFDWQ